MTRLSGNLVLLLCFSSLIDITAGFGTSSPVCVSCINDTCVKCTQGSYLESGTCHSCPEHCTSCYSSEVCYKCTEGYYGLSCQENCRSSICLNNTCDKDSGICLHGCIEGYYLYGLSCYPCATGCKTCANFSNNCLECKGGSYGSSCQYLCSVCKDAICSRDNCTHGCSEGFFKANGEYCHSCNTNCTSCSVLFDNCHTCKSGYFGQGCQFVCSDCSPCNFDGSCPTTTGPAPSTTIQPTKSTKVSVATSLPTTTISTTTNRAPTSTTQLTTQSKQSVTTSLSTSTISTTTPSQTSASEDFTSPCGRPSNSSQPPTTMVFSSANNESTSFPTTTTDSKSSGRLSTNSPQPPTNTPPNSEDNTLIIYAAAGGGGGLVVIVLIIIFVTVCKRRGRAKQSEIVVENIDMTENENYISAEEIDEITRKSTNTQVEVKQNEQNDNDDLYSQPNKMHRPIMVTMEA